MADLEFKAILAKKSVELDDGTSVRKKYTLRELTGDQRAEWNKKFDMQAEFVDGKLTPKFDGNIKLPSATEFLALCFYDKDDGLVDVKVIGALPNSTIEGLHKAALELSGMDPASLKKAKNELEESEDSGTE